MAYVYRHVRFDKNVPFYIGVGIRNDIKRPYSRAFDKCGRNKIWKRIVARTPYEVEIIFDDLTPEEAHQKEIEFIALYKRFTQGGPLVNLTDGGEGNIGKKMAPKLYEKWNQKSVERRKPILQYGANKKFIAEHLSITHAVKATGVTQSVLLRVLKTNGRLRTGGYHWIHKPTSSEYPKDLIVEKLTRKPNPKLSEKHKNALIKGGVAARRKLLLNVVTGIYYEDISEASIAFGVKRTTLNAMLKGQNKNKTDLIYA